MSRPPADHDEDLRLVAAANAGDARAFEALYERYAGWAHALALRFAGEPADAADAVQDVFLYLLRKFPGFELTSRMTTFLYPAVRHAAQERRRKRARYADDEAALVATPAREEPDAGARTELAAALAGLPEGQREVLLLRYADGLSESEIADALGIPEGTVKSRAHHALRSLRVDPRTRPWFEDRGLSPDR